MLDWSKAARSALVHGPVAMITVTAKQGSAPREVGARMIVTPESFEGTIGGGRLEHIALEQARRMLELSPGSWRMQDYPLGPLLGQCCGGRVKLLIEHLDPAAASWLADVGPAKVLVTDLAGETLQRLVQPPPTSDEAHDDAQTQDRPRWLREQLPAAPRPVLLFGAGHVGKAIVHAAQGLPLAITCYETRPEFCKGDACILADEEQAESAARAAGPDTAVVILTHDHGLDYRLSAAALAGEACFVGLIGSATKRARFLSRLAKDGIDAARLTCPIGMPGIPGRSPQAIAIAVLAQLLALGEPA